AGRGGRVVGGGGGARQGGQPGARRGPPLNRSVIPLNPTQTAERRQHEKGLLGSYLQIDFGRIGPKGLWGVGGASGPVIRRGLFDHVREPGAGPRSRSATADGPCRIRQL